MSNSIATTNKFVPILDEIYKMESLTAQLDGNNDLVQQGANVKELKIPMLSVQGLATYSRSGGYVGGDVTMTLETKACNYDRGRKFTVDYMDNAESANIAFGSLSKEFIRTQVAPEIDAFRFATYAQKCITGSVSNAVSAAISGSSATTTLMSALRAAINYLDEAEVPEESRYLFITPTLMGLIDDLDSTKSKNVIERFAKVVRVPQTRFYTKITQYDGTTSGQEAGGYIKDATNGKNINFFCVHKDALIQYAKHIAPKIITPEANQDADAWAFGYRNVGIADIYNNKLTGLYLHYSTT